MDSIEFMFYCKKKKNNKVKDSKSYMLYLLIKLYILFFIYKDGIIEFFLLKYTF